jgi:regulator of RNase E activity RraA
VVGSAITQRSCPEKIHRDQPLSERKSHMSTRDVPFFAEPNDVWVVDAKGCTFSHFGEIAAKMQQEHNLAGTIVDGFIRDGQSIKRTGYPFFCKGQTPYSGMHRIETVEINGTVTLHDVQVNPGDLIAADANGICVVPREIVEIVYEEMKKAGIC